MGCKKRKSRQCDCVIVEFGKDIRRKVAVNGLTSKHIFVEFSRTLLIKQTLSFPFQNV